MLNFVQRYREYKTTHDLSLLKLFTLWIMCFTCIASLYSLEKLFLGAINAPLLIASFGATSVIVFAIPNSPFARPRAVIGGQSLSAFIGVFIYILFNESGVAVAMAVSTSLVMMVITDTLHPPASATAFSTVIATPELHELGFLFVFFPCFFGSVFICILAFFFHKLYASVLYSIEIKKLKKPYIVDTEK